MVEGQPNVGAVQPGSEQWVQLLNACERCHPCIGLDSPVQPSIQAVLLCNALRAEAGPCCPLPCRLLPRRSSPTSAAGVAAQTRPSGGARESSWCATPVASSSRGNSGAHGSPVMATRGMASRQRRRA